MGRTFYHRNDIRPALIGMKLSARRVIYMWLASLPRELNLETGKIEIIFDHNNIFEMKINEYAEACNIDYSAAYRQIKEAIIDLMGFVLTLDYNLTKKIDPTLPSDWIAPFQIAQTGTGYSKGDGFIRIKFAPELRPIISDLTTGFTGQFLESALAIPESNSSKLYLILREWVSTNKYINNQELLVDDLRELLGLSGVKTYESYANIKKWFFDRSIAKLEEKTEFSNIKMEIVERRARKAYKVKISWDIDTKELNKKEKEITDFQNRLKKNKQAVGVDINVELRQFGIKWLTKQEAESFGLHWNDGLTNQEALEKLKK